MNEGYGRQSFVIRPATEYPSPRVWAPHPLQPLLPTSNRHIVSHDKHADTTACSIAEPQSFAIPQHLKRRLGMRPEHCSAGLQHERRVIKESPLPSTGFRTMTLESAYYLSQIVAAFAVASPLLFVGLEMQKNVRTQRATMHQAVVSQTLDTTRFYDSSPNAKVCASLCSAEECMGLTPGEISIAGRIMRLNVLNLEEAHWQRDNGSLSDDAVQSTIASPQRRFAMPGIRTAFGIWHLAWSVFQVPGHSGRAPRAP